MRFPFSVLTRKSMLPRGARRIEAALLALCLGGVLAAGCARRGAEPAPATPTLSPTPWPTLAAVGTEVPLPVLPGTQVVTGTPSADVTPSADESPVAAAAGPQLVDQFRAHVRPDATDVYPLEGVSTYPVRIEVLVLSGTLDPALVITNPAGDELAYVDNGGAGEPEVVGQFLFPEDGYYELGILAAAGEGDVGVSVYRLDPADLVGGGTFGGVGEVLHGVIEHPATYHTFRVPIQRGQRFDVVAEAVGETLDLQFEIYTPDGELLAARDDNVGLNPALWNAMPDQDGEYTIVVSNYGETVGEYDLRVTPSEGGEPADVGGRTELTLQGTPRRSTWLTLEGRTLDAVSVEARPLDAGVDIEIAVYDSYGNRLTKVDQTGVGEEEDLALIQFPSDGTYQVEFTTLNEGGTIEYYIQPIGFTELEDRGDYIVAGGFGKTGEIDGPGSVLAFVFDGSAGDLIGVDAHATSSTGLDIGFDLFAPDGTMLESRDDTVGKDPVLDRLELEQSGRYAVTVWNYAGTTGTFDIYVTNPEAPATPPPDADSGEDLTGEGTDDGE
jgi:hypothetical protein